MYSNYAAWNISEWEYPSNGSIEDKIKYFSRFGVLAANIHNTQPWKLKIIKNSLLIEPDYTKHLPIIDPDLKSLYISLGCFIKNVEVVAASKSYVVEINIENKIIFLKFKNGKNKKLADLVDYIPKRYSNRLPYSDKKIQDLHIKQLEKIVNGSSKLKFSKDSESINYSSKLYGQAVVKEAEKGVDRELMRWLRPADTSRYDGMPLFIQGLSAGMSKFIKLIVPIAPRKIGPKFVAKIDSSKIANSPLIAVIDGKANTRLDQINVGREYQELALKCFSFGFFVAPMHSVIEDKVANKKLKTIFSTDYSPQMFFRLGYASNQTYHTPRKPVEWVLDTEQELINSMGIDLTKQSLDVGNYNINYIKSGKGSPVILVHGGNIGWGQWYPNIEEIAKKHTVYAIDMPGAGRSTKVNFNTFDLYDYVSVLDSFIKKLKLKNVSLVGSSMGGWATVKVANINKDVKKIILVDSVGFSLEKTTADKILGNKLFAKFITKTIFKPGRENQMIENLVRSTFYNPGLLVSREFIDYFYETTETSHNMLFISRMIRDSKSLYLAKDLPKVIQDTLIIWGDKDTSLPLENSQKNFSKIKNLKIEIIKDGGHIVSIEKSKEFNKLVLDFL